MHLAALSKRLEFRWLLVYNMSPVNDINALTFLGSQASAVPWDLGRLTATLTQSKLNTIKIKQQYSSKLCLQATVSICTTLWSTAAAVSNLLLRLLSASQMLLSW